MTVSLSKKEAAVLPMIMRYGTEGLEKDDEYVAIAQRIEEKLVSAQVREMLKQNNEEIIKKYIV